MSRHVNTYTELKQQIHEDLRTQHPEWVQPTGECPECDEHEARLRELLEAVARSETTTETAQQVLVENQAIPTSRHETS